VARAVELGASMQRAPEEQFYGDRDSFIVDPFGHGWTIATYVEDVGPPSPVTRLHRAIALRYVTGPAAALSDVDALGHALDDYPCSTPPGLRPGDLQTAQRRRALLQPAQAMARPPTDVARW
jgi:hypothetical protein